MRIKPKTLLILLSLLYLSGSVFVVQSFSDLYRQQQISEQREQLAKQVAFTRAKIESLVYQEVFAAESIVIIANLDMQFIEQNWNTLASGLASNSQLIRNIALAPDNIVKYVYPFDGNERALGLDYSTAPKQLATIEKARQQRGIFIAGPLPLVQGGTGLILRFPLYANVLEDDSYWGTLSVVLDDNAIYEQLSLSGSEHITYALKGADSAGEKGRLFFGEAQTFANADLVETVQIPNGTWVLGAKYRISEHTSYQHTLIVVVGISVSLILYFSILFLVRAYLIVKETSLQDDLTHLANRRSIMQRLHYLTQDMGENKQFAIINIDLNGFKSVNDTYGHDAGDALLIHVARNLKKQLRDTDIIARLGGDEFLILLHRINNEEQVIAVVDKLRRHMSSAPLYYKGNELYASLSFGYSCYTQVTLDIENLLSEADARMYADKRRQKAALAKKQAEQQT
ncbi:diguanylate cyclase domain-containing protein [Pseudoalteromonas sp. SSDWG2]|uniref:diguanylate cyclase domain-containing protein n=1 Tax=Pseudoalteromonas sp. SSDWG2 TaxID=3139391 RepID=UPI003BA93C27